MFMDTNATLFDDLRKNPYYANYSDEELQKTIEIEKYGASVGADKFKKDISKKKEGKEEEATFYGSILKREKLEAIALNLQHIAEEKRGAGRASVALQILRELDPFIVAAYGLDSVLSCLSRERAVQNVAESLGARIETGILAQITCKEAPRLWKKVEGQVRGRKGYYQSAVLRHIVEKMALGDYGDHNATERIRELAKASNKKNGISIELWNKDMRVHLGTLVLDVIMRTTGIVELKRGDTRTPDKIICSPAIAEWVRDGIERRALMSPEYVPLPIPAKDWTTPYDGGYHTPLISHYPLVRKATKNFLEELADNADMSKVYTAVNAAQRTAWRINRRVFEVAKEFWDKGIRVNALPDAPELVLPPCPICGQVPTAEERGNNNHPCFHDNEQVLRLWKDAAKRAFEERIANGSRNIEVAYTLCLADMFLNEEKFFFPYYLDFRGRLYCRVSYLSPQGSGLGKSLIEFAEGKHLGTQEAADWLAIHVANSWGHDKLTFSERIQWTKDNTEMLLAIAENPYDNRQWATLKIKEAWPALAATFEWAGYIREGLSFVSHLPIGQDGTCSGLQHYAALLHDEHTARQVNVLPSERPADVYKAVAEQTIKILEALVGDPEEGEMAMAWLETGIINRKLTKRSVMTLPYGATSFSCKNYILDYYSEVVHEKGKVGPWETSNEQAKACCWLGNKVWQAIKDVLTVAPVAMDLLQKTAKVMARQKLPLNWTTPSGFRVQQFNVAYTVRRIKLALSGDIVYSTREGREAGPVKNDHLPKGMRVTLAEPTDMIDEQRQASGVAPNFIHSLDASALVLTINKMVEHGVRSFALVHDSFATHACDSALLAEVLRDEFAKMYTENDPLKMLYDEFTMMLEIIGADDAIKEIKELQGKMPYGKFDVNTVRNSLYFFA